MKFTEEELISWTRWSILTTHSCGPRRGSTSTFRARPPSDTHYKPDIDPPRDYNLITHEGQQNCHVYSHALQHGKQLRQSVPGQARRNMSDDRRPPRHLDWFKLLRAPGQRLRLYPNQWRRVSGVYELLCRTSHMGRQQARGHGERRPMMQRRLLDGRQRRLRNWAEQVQVL